jgi:hypothetical protein
MTETPETLAQRCISVADAVGDDPERAGDTLRKSAAALEAQAAQIAERDAQIEALRADAERYRWLRPRLQVRAGRSMGGTVRECLEVRIGQSFFDTPTRAGKGYLNLADFDGECRLLDVEIDAAMAAKEPK